MNNNSIFSTGVIIAIICLILAIIGGALVIAYKNSNFQHQEFCTKWLQQLDISKKHLENQFLPGDATVAQFNAEVAEYNKQCYY